MTSPVGSRCGLFRFDRSSLFSLPVSKANTTHCSRMESPLQQLEKIRSQKVFLKKVSFFQGEVSSLSKLGQSRIRSSSRCSRPSGQAKSSFLHPPPQVSGKVRVPNFRQPAMPDRGSSQLPRYLHVWQLPWVEAEAGGRVHARAARCQPDT